MMLIRRRLAAAVIAVAVAVGSRGRLCAEDLPVSAPAEEIAVFPFEDLSAAAAPAEEIGERFREALEARGLRVLRPDATEAFLRRHRVRWVGGISREVGKSLREETGAGAVLVASVDLFDAGSVPRFALTARLVSAGPEPRILWMDAASGAGDEKPGVLDLGLVYDVALLEERAIDRLAGSLDPVWRLGHVKRPGPEKAARSRRPRSFFRSPEGAGAWKAAAKTAVLPFANGTTAPDAGQIVTLQIVRALVNGSNLEVLEPGVVRETLLQSRLIQEEGLSVPQADLLRAVLGVDLALFGEVTEYVEGGPAGFEPAVDFSVRAIDTQRGQVIWSSISQERGFKGAVFFGLGRIPTAHLLTSEMSRSLVATLEGPKGAR